MKDSPLGSDPFADLETVGGPPSDRRRLADEPDGVTRPKPAPRVGQPDVLKGKSARMASGAAKKRVGETKKRNAPTEEAYGLDRLPKMAESKNPGQRNLRRHYMALQQDLTKLITDSSYESVKVQSKVDQLLGGFETNLDHALSGLPKHDGESAALVDELIGRTRDLVRSLRPKSMRKRVHALATFFSGDVVDEFGRDEVFTEKVVPLLDFLYTRYWRVEATGIRNVPAEGRALLVANHAGVLPFDGAMIAYALKTEHPAGRIPRFLIEDWFATLPFLSSILTKTGQIRASQENAERMLKRDQLVGVFPEGIKGVGKYFRQRYQVQRFGRGGMVRLCIRTGSPAIPVAVVGSEETYPIVAKSSYLARMSGFPFFPMTFTWPALGPAGLIPMPSKWFIHFGSPIELDEYSVDSAQNDLLVNKLNEKVRNRIQSMINEILKHRRSVWFG